MDFIKIYKDSSKLKEKRIAFYEDDDDLKDYLNTLEEIYIPYEKIQSQKYDLYKFQPEPGSKWAEFCYLGNGFYYIKFEDMLFKGVCLGDFQLDLKQLKSIFESSDNKSPRIREDADIKNYDYDEWIAKEKAHKEKLIKTCQDDPGRVVIEDIKSTHDDDYFLEKAVTAKITSIDELKSFVFANYGDYPVRINWPDKNLIPVTRITVINDYDD